MLVEMDRRNESYSQLLSYNLVKPLPETLPPPNTDLKILGLDNLNYPNIEQKLSRFKPITRDEQELHWMAEAFGKLKESNYVPAFGWEWASWPDWYRKSVLSHYYHKVFLNEINRVELYRAKFKAEVIRTRKNGTENSATDVVAYGYAEGQTVPKDANTKRPSLNSVTLAQWQQRRGLTNSGHNRLPVAESKQIHAEANLLMDKMRGLGVKIGRNRGSNSEDRTS